VPSTVYHSSISRRGTNILLLSLPYTLDPSWIISFPLLFLALAHRPSSGQSSPLAAHHVRMKAQDRFIHFVFFSFWWNETNSKPFKIRTSPIRLR
jgi:hypothetical protein